MNRNIKNLRRLSGAANRKLETLIQLAARAIRDVVLDEGLNRLAKRPQIDQAVDARSREAIGRLDGARAVALALGKAYRDTYVTGHVTGLNLRDWYQACGLDPDGNLHDNLITDEDP